MIGLYLFFFLVIGGIVSYCFYDSGHAERHPGESERRYTYLIDPLYLPSFLFAALICFLVVPYAKAEGTTTVLLSNLFLLIVYIGVYYALLVCVLPLLRRTFSARACATLWLLPNLLYIGGNIRNMTIHRAPFLLTFPRRWITVVAVIWAVGFFAVLLWQIISHHIYRRRLLRNAVPVLQRELNILWTDEQVRCNRKMKRPIPIVVSAEVTTPLTIGLLERKQRLVLPHLNYTREEFRLIFRHEMGHVRRGDVRMKAAWGFFTALCWFNPLMWLARHNVSGDLELGCDELVLSGENEQRRRQYADLLLRTAGSSRGYTTCLSAAASNLRYRLKNVVSPRKCLSGTIAVGLVACLLFAGINLFALADTPSSAAAILPQGETLSQVWFVEDPDTYEYINAKSFDADALVEYLSTLTVRHLYSETDTVAQGSYAAFYFNGTHLNLYDGLLKLDNFHDSSLARIYAVDDKIDWDYIKSLCTFSQ